MAAKRRPADGVCRDDAKAKISEASKVDPTIRSLQRRRPTWPSHDARRHCLWRVFAPEAGRRRMRPLGHETGLCDVGQVQEWRDVCRDPYGLLVCCVSRVLIAGRHFDPKQRCLHHPERQQEVRSIAHKRLRLHTHMYMHLHLHLLIACSINDSVMELLIMISACEGGSAKSVTGTRISYRSLSHPPTDCACAKLSCRISPTRASRRRSSTAELSQLAW